MSRDTGARLYRACVRCRQRKIKCDLTYSHDRGYLPCSKCTSDGHRCVIAKSRRGGDYSRFRRSRQAQQRTEPVAPVGMNSTRGEIDGMEGDISRSSCGGRFRHRSLRQPNIVEEGIVDEQVLKSLLQYYFMVDEPFLLAAVISIATQEQPDLAGLHDDIWRYTERLIMQVVLGAGAVRCVGTVEALDENSDLKSERTEDNSMAWSLVGLAVRQAYLLHLETYSFRGEVKIESDLNYTYLADRQISIQMGQAFWCRGPGLSTRFTVHDYPSLQPQEASGIDYASFIQAQVELTTLFGNVHDILFASTSRTMQLMLVGDYTKYLDDSSKALDMWKGTWRNVRLPSHLHCLLTVQSEYLRLYVNAFAFQAVLYRDSKEGPASERGKPGAYFPFSVMASPDGRHIYIAIEAARDVLKCLMNHLNPTEHLRFLPVRYYLYQIHASVFLFKALSVGALTADESHDCTMLVKEFITMLQMAATGPNHIAYKYGTSLAHLWCQDRNTPNDVLESRTNDALFDRGAQLSDPSVFDPLQEPLAHSSFPELFADDGVTTYFNNSNFLENSDVLYSTHPFLRGGSSNYEGITDRNLK
ncbi:hypothetical protein BO86DRAFT_423851 [Aspergillus japonicus CBS 114.51]|uniref:Zn(2)-C6 fungal-type domain-containing protein n=1 Tax=Aspergillus japonicus CBS 114.51 TaxID=1448312 RepID=A0A8T8XGH5_ASPJA|nr:hypothetical protein BO86DRAFT_423851 [Aspergillus japonicus CBS 114.51]RAH87305.1 hypothetical protein BO86DRAFT_423851 [Aspergillus japonicus CBS 114.51]